MVKYYLLCFVLLHEIEGGIAALCVCRLLYMIGGVSIDVSVLVCCYTATDTCELSLLFTPLLVSHRQ